MGRTKLLVVLVIVCAVKCLAMTYDELDDFAEYLKNTSLLGPILNDDDYDDDEVVTDHAWEESGKFEGDLILNERQRSLIVEGVAYSLAPRNGIRDGAMKWPNNEVIFYINEAHFTNDQVQVIRNGMEELTRRTCIKFRLHRKGDRDVVVIQGNRIGCFSQVGYQGGAQVINLNGRHRAGIGCFQHGTVMHELLHTLGFYHMHSSPERDDYIVIVWENIARNDTNNFYKYELSEVSNFGVEYDYNSCLHYSRRAFSANGRDTIVPKRGRPKIGQRKVLSEKDAQKVINMYCDYKSDNVQAGKNAPNNTETKNKTTKHTFEEIAGYFKGKTVAIKILPVPS